MELSTNEHPRGQSVDWDDSNEVNVEVYDEFKVSVCDPDNPYCQYVPRAPATSLVKSYVPGGATPLTTPQYTKSLASDFKISIKQEKTHHEVYKD